MSACIFFGELRLELLGDRFLLLLLLLGSGLINATGRQISVFQIKILSELVPIKGQLSKQDQNYDLSWQNAGLVQVGQALAEVSFIQIHNSVPAYVQFT